MCPGSKATCPQIQLLPGAQVHPQRGQARRGLGPSLLHHLASPQRGQCGCIRALGSMQLLNPTPQRVGDGIMKKLFSSSPVYSFSTVDGAARYKACFTIKAAQGTDERTHALGGQIR